MRTKTTKRDLRIEPSRGLTYSSDKIAVYEYGTYPRSSVLAGRTKRTFLDDFETVAEAKAAYPDADVSMCSGFVPDAMMDLPGEDSSDPYGDNADAAREHANG